jgi:DNA-binding response OmpR family regulator
LSTRAESDRRIVVVESQSADRARNAEALKSAGYDVTSVARPEEALAALTNDSAPVDLLVTDVAMPGVTGLALAERLHASHPSVPVLFITSSTDGRIDPLRIFDHGDILVKPFAPADLLAKVREALSAIAS